LWVDKTDKRIVCHEMFWIAYDFGTWLPTRDSDIVRDIDSLNMAK
jgi:hypothetical protein